MVRMKLMNLYKTEDIPDHVIEELKALILKMMEAIAPITEKTNCNLTLSAMNHILALMVKMYISEDPMEIQRAALNLAKGFLGNVKFYTGVDVMKIDDPHSNETL